MPGDRPPDPGWPGPPRRPRPGPRRDDGRPPGNGRTRPDQAWDGGTWPDDGGRSRGGGRRPDPGRGTGGRPDERGRAPGGTGSGGRRADDGRRTGGRPPDDGRRTGGRPPERRRTPDGAASGTPDPVRSPGRGAASGAPDPFRSPGRDGGRRRAAGGDDRYGRRPDHYGAPDPYGGGPDRYGDDRGGRDGRGRRSWRQRVVLVTGGVIVTICLLGASVAAYALHKYNSIDRVKDINISSAASGEPENYLIVAVDTREGQETVNTDTIMVVRIDPKSDRVALTSFNRDLMVTIADTGKIGMINSAYNRPSGGEQVLIDTIRENFDIPINHFVEVNFQSFQQVVDAVGGVPLWIPYPVRDTHSGLYQYDTGCITLNGEQGLAFARSRYFQVQRPDGSWDQDGSADLGRVQRQQVFIQRALAKALGQVKGNPARLNELLDIGLANIRIDENLSLGDLLDLSGHFKNFDPSTLEAYPLPVTEYPPDHNRLLLDESAAEEYLNVFRGLAPGELRPGVVDVTVLNGTEGQSDHLAGDVTGALQKIGFKVEVPDDADQLYEHTVIYTAPGQATYGQRVARHLTAPAEIQEDPALLPGHVRLVAGLDFTTVHEQPTPIDELVTPTSAAAPGDTTPTTAAAATPTTVPAPTTTTTAPTGFVVGEPPEGQTC
jgi:LCP family protein required for cell wall assembly